MHTVSWLNSRLRELEQVVANCRVSLSVELHKSLVIRSPSGREWPQSFLALLDYFHLISANKIVSKHRIFGNEMAWCRRCASTFALYCPLASLSRFVLAKKRLLILHIDACRKFRSANSLHHFTLIGLSAGISQHIMHFSFRGVVMAALRAIDSAVKPNEWI